jgi:hypothetical protein
VTKLEGEEMKKWEYCLVQSSKTASGVFIGVTKPNNQFKKYENEEANLVSILQNLGEEGWEAVSLSAQVEILKDGLGGINHTLLKRPAQPKLNL